MWRSASCAHFGISGLALTLPLLDHVEERKTRSSGSICFGLGITLIAFVLVLARRAGGQTAGGSADWGHLGRLEGRVTILLIVATGLLLLIGLIAKILDLRLKRDGEVVAVKGVISDALGGDPELFELPLTATARVPLWKEIARRHPSVRRGSVGRAQTSRAPPGPAHGQIGAGRPRPDQVADRRDAGRAEPADQNNAIGLTGEPERAHVVVGVGP